MAKEAGKTHTALRTLQERFDKLGPEEEQIKGQLEFLTREIRKQKRNAEALSVSIMRIRQAYSNLSKAPIASLPEYKDLRLLLPTNKKMLDRTKRDLIKAENAMVNLKERMKEIKKEQEYLKRELASWNRVIKFRRSRRD